MCDCYCSNDFWDPVFDLSNWIPVGVAILAYFIQAWIRQVFNRREQSRLAVMYLDEIRKEIETGLERLVYMYEHGGKVFQVENYKPQMPTANWTGVRDVLPDTVNMRILNVMHHNGYDEDCADLRHHLKNYYTVICKFGNDVIDGKLEFCGDAAREDIDGTRMILAKIDTVMKQMKTNAGKHVWPW